MRTRTCERLRERIGNTEGTTNYQPARPHPGTYAMHREGRSSGLPSSFPGPAFPCTGHSGVRRGSSGIQQRGLRRTGVRWIRTRHRLPVSPSCRRAGRHHSLDWARFYSPGAPLSPHSLASREALINSWRRTWHGKQPPCGVANSRNSSLLLRFAPCMAAFSAANSIPQNKSVLP